MKTNIKLGLCPLCGAEVEVYKSDMVEIKNKFTNKVIASGETLIDAINNCNKELKYADLWGTDLHGTDLQGTDLRGADLHGTDLHGTDLRDADLRGADLQGTDLRDADLRDADLRGADLQGTDLRDADLTNIKINWMSHDLITEILRQNAKNDIIKRQIAGLILVSKDWCWEDFLKIDIPEKEWALEILRQYETDKNKIPVYLDFQVKI